MWKYPIGTWSISSNKRTGLGTSTWESLTFCNIGSPRSKQDNPERVFKRTEESPRIESPNFPTL